MISRSKKVMYLETVADTFNRMKGFTSMAINKNAKEYTRQYVDEDHEVTDVTGISTSVDYAFDQIETDEVHDKLIAIIDEEKVGEDAVINLLSVDFTTEGTAEKSFKAIKRQYAVVPGSEGDNLDAYTYGGTFKVKGARIVGEATTTDDWATCQFTTAGVS